jgi:hypothetical protein
MHMISNIMVEDKLMKPSKQYKKVRVKKKKKKKERKMPARVYA